LLLVDLKTGQGRALLEDAHGGVRDPHVHYDRRGQRLRALSSNVEHENTPGCCPTGASSKCAGSTPAAT
jgi:hypothetical protein